MQRLKLIYAFQSIFQQRLLSDEIVSLFINRLKRSKGSGDGIRINMYILLVLITSGKIDSNNTNDFNQAVSNIIN